jgi:hypothetical protein
LTFPGQVSGKAAIQVVRLILTCLLCYALLQGWPLGRWIAVFLSGLAALAGLIVGAVLIRKTDYGIYIILLGIINLICGIALCMPYAGIHFTKANSDDIAQIEDDFFSRNFWRLITGALFLTMCAPTVRDDVFNWVVNHPLLFLPLISFFVFWIGYQLNKFIKQ